MAISGRNRSGEAQGKQWLLTMLWAKVAAVPAAADCAGALLRAGRRSATILSTSRASGLTTDWTTISPATERGISR